MKKILIISSWGPTLRRGGPLMLDNLFRFFPKNSYVVLSKADGAKDTVLNGGNKPVIHYFYNSMLARLFAPLEIVGIIKQAMKAIKKEHINAMFGTSTGNPLIATYLLHLITGKKYFIMLFDLYDGNLIESWIDRLLARVFEGTILRHAEKLIVTNQGTREYYLAKYGVDATIIQNSIVVSPDVRPKKIKVRRPTFPYTVIFAGVIYWAQMESLKDVIEAIKSIKKPNIKLLLYAPQPEKSLQKMGIVPSSKITISQAPPQEMQEIISRADVALVPLSFHTKAPDIVKTATPGKFSEYLLAGVPILVHARADSFLSRYCRENNLALVVDDQNIETLKEAIIKLVQNQKLRKSLVENAQRVFWKDYVAEKNSKKLQRLFS